MPVKLDVSMVTPLTWRIQVIYMAIDTVKPAIEFEVQTTAENKNK